MMSDDRPATLEDIKGLHHKLDGLLSTLSALTGEHTACQQRVDRCDACLFGVNGLETRFVRVESDVQTLKSDAKDGKDDKKESTNWIHNVIAAVLGSAALAGLSYLLRVAT